MRLGGPIFTQTETPEAWVDAVVAAGYRAAYCPVSIDADRETILAYEQAARHAELVIAEVGAWSNPLSPNQDIAKEALEKCKASLDLADQIGACCCVNISGSRGDQWDGPHPANLTDATFELIVSVVRDIIDSVKPRRTFYTLEIMPWMFPDSVESYRRLIDAIGRKAFAVHFDPVNMICSPQHYFSNGAVIKNCFKQLGAYIKSCHAKDIRLSDRLTVNLAEVRPGKGHLDYRTFLKCLSQLDSDTPLMLEHLPNETEYRLAAQFIRNAAAEEGLAV